MKLPPSAMLPVVVASIASLALPAAASSFIVRLHREQDETASFASARAHPSVKCEDLARLNGGNVRLVYDEVLYGCSIEVAPPATRRGLLQTNATDTAIIEALLSDPSVQAVEIDQQLSFDTVPSWGLDRVDQRDLPLDNQRTKLDATNVRVYVVDSGIRGDHQEFVGELASSTSTCHSDLTSHGNALFDDVGHG